MPTAMLARIRFTPVSVLPAGEYLHREETLFVELEWSWVADKSQAMIFPSLELAEQEGKRQKQQDEKADWCAFALVCGNSDAPAARERREADRIATALSSVPTDEARGVSPSLMSTGDAKTRKRASRQNRSVARERKAKREAAADEAVEASCKPVDPRGADKWKEVFQTRVSPAEAYANLERRHLA